MAKTVLQCVLFFMLIFSTNDKLKKIVYNGDGGNY